MQQFDPPRAEVEEALTACALFASIVGEARDDLLSAFEGVRIETGEVLIHQGDEADALYLIRHGRLRTVVEDDHGNHRTIGTVGKAEVVGEMALITDHPRSATVAAMRDTELYRLPAELFLELTQRHPEILRPFAGVVVERLRNAITRPPRPTLPATIVLLPAPGVDVVDFAHQLVATLTDYDGRVVVPADAEGRDNPAAWLLDLENAVDVSVLVAEDEPTAWTRQCLRHADRVLLVVDEGRPATRLAVERDEICAERLDELPVELVTRYRDAPHSSSWLVGRQLDGHHNLRWGSTEDLTRLVRRLTGEMTVLVLAGGGARGFAHFGAIRALQQAGMPIDAVVGTSAGSLVGGVLARYGEVESWEEQFLQWFDDVRWRRDLTPPAVALLTGEQMTEGFREAYGERRIEDLVIDFVAVSTDLTHARPHVHTSGPLWQAIRASSAVPGLFPPVAIDGCVLVDGGLVANLPVSIAADRHPGARIVAIEVGSSSEFATGMLDGTGIASGWQALRHRGGYGPLLPRVLARLTDLGRDQRIDQADLIIEPDVAEFSLTDTTASRTIVERGYDAVARAIDAGELRQLLAGIR
jgi:NTE family protein